MAARILDATEAQYHADALSPVPTLSASIAKLLISQSPAHAFSAHPRLGGVRHESTKAMDAGTLIHALVLGKGAQVQVIDAPDYRTKAAQAARDEAEAAGLLPIIADKYAPILAMAETIKSRLADRGVVLDGVSECPIEWSEAADDGEPVLCRSMLDHVRGSGVIYDLKTTQDASPEAFARSCATYVYDVQAAAYTRALAALRPELAGRIRFVFVAVELAAPNAIGLYEPAGDMRELGDRRWQRAVELWAKCLREKTWPDYGRDVRWLSMPGWLMQREEETAA